MSADAGYFSGENAAEDGAGLDLLIAAGRDDPAAAATKAAVYSVDRFGYDPTRDVWVCPADKLLHLAPPTGRRGRPSNNQYLAAAADCADCPLRAALPQARRRPTAASGQGPPVHRRDALQAPSAGRPPTLRPPQGHRRAGLRPTQGGARVRHPQPARARSRRRRVPAGLPRPQPRQAAARLPAPVRHARASGGLILSPSRSRPPDPHPDRTKPPTTARQPHASAHRRRRPSHLSADCLPSTPHQADP